MPATIIFRYFAALSSRQQEQLQQIGPLYTTWNQRLNLISRRDIDHIYLKHVLHSLSIAKVVTFMPGTRVLDVGTGGGFPGIPLAILFPKTKFHLVDAIGKKVRAVQQIAATLGLRNVSIEQTRVEYVTAQYDFVLGRAVTNLIAFYNWVQYNIIQYHRHPIPNGILYLKGQEPLSLTTMYRTYAIQDFFDEPFFTTKQIVHITGSQKNQRS